MKKHQIFYLKKYKKNPQKIPTMMNSWNQMTSNSNGEDADTDESTTNELGQLNYKTQYQQLKRKLKFLIFVSNLPFLDIKTD